jgi:hypothetical protein
VQKNIKDTHPKQILAKGSGSGEVKKKVTDPSGYGTLLKTKTNLPASAT